MKEDGLKGGGGREQGACSLILYTWVAQNKIWCIHRARASKALLRADLAQVVALESEWSKNQNWRLNWRWILNPFHGALNAAYHCTSHQHTFPAAHSCTKPSYCLPCVGYTLGKMQTLTEEERGSWKARCRNPPPSGRTNLSSRLPTSIGDTEAERREKCVFFSKKKE